CKRVKFSFTELLTFEIKHFQSRSSRPSLELYKPPVLRGKKSVPRNIKKVELFEENTKKEISSPEQEILEQQNRILSKIFNVLSNNSIIKEFYNGVIISLERYFECKDKLRGEEEIKENEKIEESFYFLVWQNFIFLTFELAQIVNDERIIVLIFNIFNYLFNKQILNTLRISELESILSILMLIGNRLELDYPLQMEELRILLRNASLNSKESWSRKMILLMIELSIVNWKIVPQIEEFYYTI
ncbi:hypothetical protein Mgra_00002125, partial [Meloidogyne graminicola]